MPYYHPIRCASVQSFLGGGTVLLTSFLLIFPATAHTTEVSGDIAGTWHVEPNHNPKAGEPAQVWIALTQQGGTIVPLQQCDCRLTVYEGSPARTNPILQPALKATSAETYQGIPGAEIVFPGVGQYQLKLIGSPRAGATFQPFELTYTVTVAPGKSVVTPASPTPKASPTALVSPPAQATQNTPSQASPSPIWIGMLGLGLLVLVIVTLRKRR